MIAILLAALLAQAPDDEKKTLALIEELKAEDAAARRRALESLLERGPAAVPQALAVLADERPGLDGQVDELVKDLRSKEWKVRDAAHKGLVRLGRHARARLQAHEGAEDAEVAWRVKAALAEIEEKEKDEAAFEYVRNAGLCEFLGRAGDAKAVPLLVRQLELPPTPNAALADAQLALRVRAAEAMGRLRARLSAEQADAVAERAVEMLVGNRDRRHGVILLQTLGRLGSSAAVTPLISLLRDSGSRDVHLKRTTLRTLAAIGDARGVAAVIRALRSEDVYLRDGAIEVLAELAGQDFGLDPRQSPEASQEKLKAARAWWGKKYGKEWVE